MAKPSNGLTPQQVNDAQHLDNMTSLQQPSAAEQSPITQNGEVKGDAPISSPPTPNPDNPSLFNEPKNPNNKVVEVESQNTSEDLDKGSISDTSSDQGSKFTEDLKGLSGDAINLTVTAQANEQGVPGDKQPELDPGVNKAGGNTGNQGSIGGGGIPRPGQAPAGAPAASPGSPAQTNSPLPSQTVESPRNVEAPLPPPPTPSTQNPITPQAQFIPEKAKVSPPSILAADSQTISEDSTATGNVLSNGSVDTTIDTTIVTLDDVTVDEAGTITYTASVNNAPETAFSVTLSNGVVINFAAGATTGSSAPQTAQGDDKWLDADSFNVTIASTSGGNYEDLDISSTATVTIDDTIDTTIVTLDDVTVDEAGTITYTASVNNAPETAFSVTLSNGVVINFAAGATTGSSAPQTAQGDDKWLDADSFNVTIASTSGGNYEDLDISSTATVTIDDTIDTTIVTLDDVTVDEAGTITYTASVNNAPETAFSVTLSNGVVINFAAGATTGSSAPQTAQGDDKWLDADSFNVTIASTSGGNYEDLDISSTATVTIDDTIDTTIVTLDDVTVDEAGTITYTASVNNAPETAFSVTLSNGVVINFAAGATTGSSAPQTAQGDDKWLDADSFNVTIASTSGGNYEDLDISSTATVTIDDTIDTTIVTLDDVTVDEAGTITYTASVNNAPETAFSVTLSNGVVINFAAGATTGSSAPQTAQGDDKWLDADSFNVTIASTSGGNYEDLDISSTATVTIDDTIDTTIVTLDDVTVDEAGTITYTASVNNAPETAFSVTLSNGVVINFAAGATTGSSAPQTAQGDDKWLDADSFNVTIASTSGGNYEDLDISSTATVTIDDTIDTTIVTLDDVTVDEAGTITYTASVNNAPETAFSVTLSNGVVINFAAGATTGSSAPQTAQGDDKWLDADSFNVTIASTSGGNYEDLDISSTATVTIDDTIDTTIVTLDDVTVDEAGTITYTASVNNAPETAFSVTLSNGVVINFAAGATTGSSAPQTAQGDDKWLDADSFNVTIASTSGGNYEDLDISSTATVTIDDTIDTTIVTLDDVTVDEAGTITYTASVNNAPETAFSVTLSNGVVINFAAGATTGSSAPQTAQGDDKWLDADSFNVTIASTSGGNYEDLDISSTATVTIDDTIDTTIVTLDDVTVDEAGTITYTASVNNAPETAFSVTLSNGVVINFAAGATTGSSAPQTAQGDDKWLDADSFNVTIASTSGGNYEDLDISSTATVTIDDTIDTTIVTLDDVTVDEAGTITYTASVNNAPETAFSVTLSNGVVINFAAGATTGSSAPQTAQGDDKWLDADSFNVTIASTSGGNYEDLDISSTATVTIDDTIDTTIVTLDDVTVDEAGTITYTASVNNAPETAFSVTLSNGVVINFAAGATTGSSAPQTAQGDDKWLDADSFNVTIASTSGGNYEDLDISSTATVTIDDTIDTTIVTLDDVTVDEAGTITYTASVNNAPETAFSVTLSNGVVINFAAGATTGSSAPQTAQGDDKWLDADSFNVTIASTSGGNYEDLDISSTATVTIDDTIDTTIVTLDDVTVDEAGTITYTASVNNAPETAFSVTLSNGVVINFAAGATTGSSAPQTAQGDDKWLDADSFNVTIASTSGGNYEDLDISSTATVTIDDTIDTTIVTLSASSVVEGPSVAYTFTATLSAASQGITTVVTDQGTITIANGATTGTLVVPVTNGDDVYIDATSLTANITSASGGNFENLILGATTSATARVTDDTDAVTVNLSASSVVEGPSVAYTFTATLSAASQGITTVVTDQGTITIANGATTGTLVVPVTNGDDVYIDATSLTANITSASGGNFENLILGATTSATARVTDDTDAVYAKITVSAASVAEGGTLTYTTSLVDASGVAVTVPSAKTVNIALTWSGTASSGSDTSALPSSITIAGGTSATTFNVSALTDLINESTEPLVVTITGVTDINSVFEGTGIAFGSLGSAVATSQITNIVPPPTIGSPTFSESNVSLITGDTNLTTTVSTSGFNAVFASAASSGTVILSGYSFVLSTPGVNSGLTSQGSTISLFNNSGIISGKIGNNSGVEVFRLSVDSSGVVSLTQYQPIDEAAGSNVISLINSVLSLQATVSTNDNGQIATGTVSIDMGGNIQFTDATPTLNVLGISANNVAGTTSGTYTWNAIDADSTPFTFTSSTATTDLKWDHPSDDGYTFALKAGTTRTYEATYQDKGITKTYFEITVNDPSSSSGSDNGTYNFVLVTPKPTQTIASGNLFSALTPTNLDTLDANTEALVVGPSSFGGAFSLVMTGSGNNATSYGGATTLNKSATDIGVNGNTIQSNGATKDNESIKIDIVQQAGFETSAVTGITLGVSSTASLSTSTQYYFKSTYVDGTQITGTNTTYDGSGFFTASFNPTKVIDYVEFFVISSNYKITSVDIDYVKKLPVTDDVLSFALVGTDFDGDASNLASFTVNRIAGTTGADDLSGTSLAESISGGAGIDKLTGGAGADILSGGSGLDTFVFSAGASGQTDVLADKISDYTIGALGTGDVIDYSASMTVGGSTATATATQAQISATGVATFASGEGAILADALADISTRFTAATDAAGEFAFFKVNGTGDYYLFISDGTNGVTANDVLVKLTGVTVITAIDLASGNLTITKGTYNGTTITPIAIDLNQDGIQYLNQQAQVVYDYTGQNLLQSTAWVSSSDGLLALDLPNNQLQISFATQAGETDLQGLAKVFDTNHDKILNSQDAGFDGFGVWQDADSDGVVDAGEFLSLTDRGIISLSLTSDGVIHTVADGDVTIYGQTTYTMTDGSTGIAEDVGFSVGTTVGGVDFDGIQYIHQASSTSDDESQISNLSLIDGDRVNLSAILNPVETIQSLNSPNSDESAISHSTIAVNIGGVDYEIATVYDREISLADTLGEPVGGNLLFDSLSGTSWTDVVEVASENGGPASISASGGSLINSYSNEAGDWTLQITSGTATVDADNKVISFESSELNNEAVITTSDGTDHELSNVDKILWH